MLITILGARPRGGGTTPPPPSGGGGLEDWTAGGTIDGASLPTTKLDTTFNLAGQTGTVHRCDTLAEFTTALTNCARGDVIVLESGVTFDTSSAIAIPAKTGTGWVYVVSGDIYDGLFPKAPGERATSADVADMATIRSTNTNTAVFTFASGASKPTHWRFVGLCITSTQDQQQGLCNIDGNTATEANIPEWIGFDRCYIYGTPGSVNVRRGIKMDGRSCFAVDCSIIGMRDVGNSDSQAISWVNGPGPFSIKNCHLQAASECIITGGESSLRRPADMEFGYCYFEKDAAWEGVYPVKASFELKYASRVYVYGSIFRRCWTSGQTGMAILLKSTSQTGVGDGSQYKTSDIIFDYCYADEYDEPFRIAGATEDSTQSTDRVVLRHCAFVDPRGSVGKGLFITTQAGPLNGVVMRNCTVHMGGSFWHLDVTNSGPAKGDSITIVDSILTGGVTPNWSAGPVGASAIAGGANALNAAFNSVTMTGNACRSTWNTQTIAGNTASTATTFQNIFTSYSSDLSVASGNWAEGVGGAGADPGVDWPALSDGIQYTVGGQRPAEV